MDRKPDFKTNLWGYEREAVLSYIDQMSKTAQESEAQLQKKMEQITLSREELEKQISEFENKVQNVSQDLEQEKGKNQKLSKMITLLQEEIDRQRRANESRERDFRQMQEQNRELQERVRQSQDKSRRYDEAAASIGSAILEAQQTAKSIVDAANGRAQSLSQEADEFISGVLEKIEGMHQDFLLLRGKMNESIALLNSRFDQIESDITHARELVLRTAGTGNEGQEPQLGKSMVQPSSTQAPGRLDLSEESLQKHRYF